MYRLDLAETSPGTPNQERAPGASVNEIGAAAITTDEIDPLDIFGEPMHATEGAQEAYGWPFPAPAISPMRRAVVACAGIALVGVLLAVAASRRYLPTPRRLATILVVAGAQTQTSWDVAAAQASSNDSNSTARHSSEVAFASSAAMPSARLDGAEPEAVEAAELLLKGAHDCHRDLAVQRIHKGGQLVNAHTLVRVGTCPRPSDPSCAAE
jgi:hypothetical protein